ncbi:HD family phosphohydrolase [Carnobacterium sp.]|uniref:HD family phosphohydrolase n=1 Tax=Carnobacterium sp. TaxID=48221 RepID=UPI00388F4701
MRRNLIRLQKKLGKLYIPSILLLSSVIIFFIMYSTVKPTALDIELFQVADETIRANATVEDTEKTKENKETVAATVSPVYTYNPDLKGIQISKVEVLFATIDEVIQETDKKYEADLKEARKKATENDPEVSAEELSEMKVSRLSEDEMLRLFKEKLNNLDDATKEFIDMLPDWAVSDLLTTNEATLVSMRESIVSVVSQFMTHPIKSEEVSEIKIEANNNLDYSDLDSNNQRIASLIIDNAIVENNTYNANATEQKKVEEMANVPPSLILQGQVIVQEGHVVDSNDMHQLELLGLLDNSSSRQSLYGLIVLIFTQALLLYYLGKSRKIDRIDHGRQITFYSIIMIASLVLMKSLQLLQSSDIDYIGLLYPAALASTLLTAFGSRRFGILANGFTAAFSIFIFSPDSGTSFSIILVLFYLLSGMMGTMITRTKITNQFWSSFIWVTVFNALFISSFILYLNMNFWSQQVFLMIFYALLSGIISYLLAVLLSPYIEVLFEENAVLTLTELSNPNSPLLKELLTKAPGTYHHSLMVANLSANAVGAIGGDSLFARVACYYHDVGKLRHSLFFVENLPPGMENPHNLLTPFESKEIIFGHVSEGVKMLENAKMPQSIIDICAQHHGTTLMKYFYVMAKEKDESVLESDFRYPGPKPQTKEAAVINIADSAEAAVRSMSHPTKESIEKFVHNLINGRITDGQFDECSISLRELKIVEKAICEGLNGTFHSRIEYPTLNN